MPTRLYLVRHGAVERAWRGRIYGRRDVALSPRGRREAEAAAALLRATALDAVQSSDLERARFGAACIARGRSLSVEETPALREIDRGAWVGSTPAEIDRNHERSWERWQLAPTRTRPPGGEDLAQVAARVLPVLDELALRHAGGAVAVVAHSWVLRVAIARALGLPLDLAPRLVLATGSVSAVDWEPVGEQPVGEPSARRHTLVGVGLDRVPPPAPWFGRPATRG